MVKPFIPDYEPDKPCHRKGCDKTHRLHGDFCSLRCAVLFAQEIGLYDTEGIDLVTGKKELGH